MTHKTQKKRFDATCLKDDLPQQLNVLSSFNSSKEAQKCLTRRLSPVISCVFVRIYVTFTFTEIYGSFFNLNYVKN